MLRNFPHTKWLYTWAEVIEISLGTVRAARSAQKNYRIQPLTMISITVTSTVTIAITVTVTITFSVTITITATITVTIAIAYDYY